MNTKSSVARSPTTMSLPRIINVILGVWLFISAFAWPHTQAERTNTWIVAVLEVVFALVAVFSFEKARYLNTILAIWLFISALSLRGMTAGTTWNNAVVAIVMCAVSLVPGGSGSQRAFRPTLA